MKKKEEKIEYIVRVDLDELKIDDDDFDDLQSLYQGKLTHWLARSLVYVGQP